MFGGGVGMISRFLAHTLGFLLAGRETAIVRPSFRQRLHNVARCALCSCAPWSSMQLAVLEQEPALGDVTM